MTGIETSDPIAKLASDVLAGRHGPTAEERSDTLLQKWGLVPETAADMRADLIKAFGELMDTAKHLAGTALRQHEHHDPEERGDG